MAEELTAQQVDALRLKEERDYQASIESSRRQYEEGREGDRRIHELTLENKRSRLEIIRIAKDTLVENSRSKSVDERDISSDDILAFANKLQTFINN